jgi:peroxiredoxin Q/BCP
MQSWNQSNSPDESANIVTLPIAGKKVRSFSATATSGVSVSSKELAGRVYVFYFYPRDNTPGCTVESQDFAANYPKFKRLGVEIFGVSRDPLRSHERFKAKFEFPFELIADPEESLCALFDVVIDKNMYGKKVRGIQRSTFLIDAEGILRQEWRKVKIDGHVEEVLAAAEAL